MEEKIAKLEKQIRILTGLLMLLVVAVFMLLVTRNPEAKVNGVLRVKGLIVEDSAGHERILIGAPVPAAAHRVRTDTARVRQIWGPGFTPQYLESYKSYAQSFNGIIILDEQGFERTGYGLLRVNGNNRIVLGLDGKNGSEAVVLAVDDADSSAGLTINSEQNLIFLGRGDASAIKPEGGKNFRGMILKDSSDMRFFEIRSESGKK